MAGIGAEFGHSELPKLRAGITGAIEVHTAGGVLATGTITNALIQVANDTITLNGVWAKYTAAASDATKAGTLVDPLLINIKASLMLTLDEAVIVLNAAAHPALAVATYSKSGTTILVITYDTYVAAGNSYTLAASAGGVVSAATLTGGQDMGVISIATEPSEFKLTQSVNQRFSLANGEDAQQKFLYLDTKGGAGNVIVAPTSLTGGTIITFSVAGNYAELRWMGTGWLMKSNSTAVVS